MMTLMAERDWSTMIKWAHRKKKRKIYCTITFDWGRGLESGITIHTAYGRNHGNQLVIVTEWHNWQQTI